MATLTTNYSLIKPGVADPSDQDLWGGMLNTDLDSIDALLKTGIDTVSRSVTANDSVIVSDRNKMILVDATGGNVTISLLAVATAGNGFQVAIKKVDSSANTVTIDANGAETIDGSATYVISSQNDGAILVSNGVKWDVSANKVTVAAASTTAAGIVELADTAETETGTDATRAVTPDGMRDALGFSKKFVSSDITIGTSLSSDQAHNLAGVPFFVRGYLKCTTADANYSVGDVIPYDSTNNRDTAPIMGISIYANATNVGVRFGFQGSIFVVNKTTYQSTPINTSSWVFYIVAVG